MKNKKIKIAIIGNCQARPLAQVLSILNSNIEIISIAIVHLLKNKEKNTYIPYFDKADFIITQLIADNYPCAFVQTSFLKRHYSSKIISIVNLYYSGYNPELIYIRNTSEGTLKSPLGEYHNKTFYDTWISGYSAEEALKRYNDYDYNKKIYSGAAKRSLIELKDRERSTDIKITDIIENNLSRKRLFFVFNHPQLNLIIEMGKRILKKIEIKINDFHENTSLKEPLNQIITPINIYEKHNLQIEFEDINYFKGVDCVIQSNNKLIINGRKNYSTIDIIDKYYEIYDLILDKD